MKRCFLYLKYILGRRFEVGKRESSLVSRRCFIIQLIEVVESMRKKEVDDNSIS